MSLDVLCKVVMYEDKDGFIGDLIWRNPNNERRARVEVKVKLKIYHYRNQDINCHPNVYRKYLGNAPSSLKINTA